MAIHFSARNIGGIVLQITILLGSSLCGLAADSVSPSELQELTGKFVTARQGRIETPIAEKREKLKTGYAGALDKALAQATSAANLDLAVEIRKEQSRLEKNEPITEEYQQDELKNLVSTFFKHSSVIDGEEAKLRTDMAGQLRQALANLQSDLTKQQRIEDAVAVKNFTTSEEAVDLVLGDTTIEALDPRKYTFLKNKVGAALGGANTATAVNGSAPASGESSRIVLIPVSTNGRQPAHASAIGDENRTDIRSAERGLFPNVAFVRNDGSVLYRNAETTEAQIIPANALYCDQNFDTPLVALNENGTLACSSDGSKGLAEQLRAETDVAQMTAASGIVSLVKKDGSVSVLGDRRTVPTPVFVVAMKDVAAIEYSGAAFASVLKKDGSVIDVSNGSPTPIPVEEIAKLWAYKLGENRSGELVSWGSLPSEIAKEAGRDPIKVFNLGQRFAALKKNGDFYLAESNDAGEWKENRDFSVALDGALSFAWLIGDNEDWISATLPASEISRSGVWKVEDLAEARK